MKLNSQNYPQILKYIKNKDIKLNAFLIEGTPYLLKDRVLYIKFDEEKKFHLNQVEKMKRVLIEYINEVAEDPIENIKLEIDGDLVKRVCKLFNGQVIKTNVEVLD